MSTLSQFMGGALIPNGRFSGNTGVISLPARLCNAGMTEAGLHVSNGKMVLSGALTASTYKTILSLSGKGVIDGLIFGPNGAVTAQTFNVRVTLDSVVVLEVSAVNVTSGTFYFSVLGGPGFALSTDSRPTSVSTQPIPFDKSLLIEVSSTLTATDNLRVAYSYYPRA